MNFKFLGKLNGIRVTRLIWIPIAVVVAILIFRFKGLIVAATVNGQPVSRLQVISQLEKEGGKSILDTMITNDLIMQEAKKEKVTVTKEEIDTQLSQITENLKASGQDLDSALAARGMSKSDLDYQLRLQILVQKMAGKDIKVEDKEIEDYFKANTASYPKNQKLDDTLKTQIKKDLESSKLNEAIQTWVTNLKTNAKINYFVSY